MVPFISFLKHFKISRSLSEHHLNLLPGAWKWKFGEFLDKYQTEDVYMVNTLPSEILKDLTLIPSLTCGGYKQVNILSILYLIN